MYVDPFHRTYYVLRGHKKWNNFLSKPFQKKNSHIFSYGDQKRDPKLHSIWSMPRKQNQVYAYRAQFIASCFMYYLFQILLLDSVLWYFSIQMDTIVDLYIITMKLISMRHLILGMITSSCSSFHDVSVSPSVLAGGPVIYSTVFLHMCVSVSYETVGCGYQGVELSHPYPY